MRLLSLWLGFVLALYLNAAWCVTANAAPTAKSFGELPVGHDAAISPDGKHTVILANLDGLYVVVVKETIDGGNKPWMAPLERGSIPKYVKWVSNRRIVISVRRSEVFRSTAFTSSFLYTADIHERKASIVIKPEIDEFRQFNDVVVDWLEDDPDHILMAFSEKMSESDPDVRKVNVKTGEHEIIKKKVNGISRWYSDGEGVLRIGKGMDDAGERRLIIYNVETKKWDSSDWYGGLDADTPIYGVLKDGTELVIGDYQGKDTLGLYIYDLQQKKITRALFHNDDYDASGVVLSKDGETVIGANYTADGDKTELLGEHSTLLDRMREKHPGYDVDFLDQTPDGKTILFRMSESTDPGGLYIYHSSSAEPQRLTKMYSGLTNTDMGKVISISYKSRDDQSIPGFITLPPSLKKQSDLKSVPFIVLPHGGPYARDAKRFDYFAQFFATRGYGVLQMNFRGSDGYGKRFADAGRNNWIVMQNDVEDGMKWLLRKGYADPKRTCIAGWSYGGYAALMGVAKDPDLYRCAIAMAALTDINDARRDLKKYRGGKAAAKEFFGEALKDASVRKANSPVHVADQIKVPVFLAHGDKDQNVHFDQFERMKRSMEKAGVNATYLEFKNEDHYLSLQKNREEFFIAMNEFLIGVNGKSEYMKP